MSCLIPVLSTLKGFLQPGSSIPWQLAGRVWYNGASLAHFSALWWLFNYLTDTDFDVVWYASMMSQFSWIQWCLKKIRLIFSAGFIKDKALFILFLILFIRLPLADFDAFVVDFNNVSMNFKWIHSCLKMIGFMLLRCKQFLRRYVYFSIWRPIFVFFFACQHRHERSPVLGDQCQVRVFPGTWRRPAPRASRRTMTTSRPSSCSWRAANTGKSTSPGQPGRATRRHIRQLAARHWLRRRLSAEGAKPESKSIENGLGSCMYICLHVCMVCKYLAI